MTFSGVSGIGSGKVFSTGRRAAVLACHRSLRGPPLGHRSVSHMAAPGPISTTGTRAGLLSAARAVGH